MLRPLNIIDLAITDDVSDDAAEVARRLDQAADLVEEFAEESAIDALHDLLAAAAAPGPGTDTLADVRRLAAEMTAQTEILQSEVERFLAVSAGRRPN
jgi:hypothetical protein